MRNLNQQMRFALRLALVAALAFTTSASAAETAQKSFATPEEAGKALIDALKANDTKALLGIFGKEAQDMVESGDPVADADIHARVVSKYEEKSTFDTSVDGRAILLIGNNDWPFPIPLVKSDAGWSFDTEEGMEEVIDRRIGRNELAAIKVCEAYGDAQREYYVLNPEKDALNHYAQKIASTPGKRDGLFWEAAEGEEQSPLGPAMARAKAEGYAGEGKDRPYHGYRYKILTAQGADAKGGAYDYVVQGKKMIGGFGLVAYPAHYGSSGVMSFIISHDGVVYEKDLGEKTEELAGKMTTFNPDKTWKAVESDDQ